MGTTNSKAKLYQLCPTCQVLCRSSTSLNSSPDSKSRSERDTSLLHESIPDTNHWNESESYTFEDPIPHHLSGSLLEESALGGCHLCSLLWNHLSNERMGIRDEDAFAEKKHEAESARAVARDVVRASGEALFVRIGVPIKEHRAERRAILILYAGKHEELPNIRSALAIWSTDDVSSITRMKQEDILSKAHPANFSKNTASDATLKLARGWIKECKKEKDHYLCATGNKSWEPPTRLLDVRGIKPRLIFSKPTMRKLRYLCLSHCWGGAEIYKLTQKTLPTLKRGVDPGLLPKNFRDAVDITRRLGYRYIWIDSLCIFQDDEEDWRREAERMAQVYLYGEVTIAALGATNSHGGCYSTRDPLSYFPCTLPTKNKMTAWYGRTWPFHNERFTNAPLLRRGWVLQERCLGARTLYFGKCGIYWECQTMRADEIFTDGFSSDGLGPTGEGLPFGELLVKALVNRRMYLVGTDSIGFPLYIKHTSSRPCPLFIYLRFQCYWYHIIEQFSQTHFTFGRDKLIAASGVINLIQDRTGLTSFAGLWREFLLEDLLWSTASLEKTVRVAEYRAPSFSWAALDGAVKKNFTRLGCQARYIDNTIAEPHSDERRYVATLVSAEIEMGDPSRHTGEVLSASIVLQGHITRFKIKRRGLKDRSRWTHPYFEFPKEENYSAEERWLALDTNNDAPGDSLDVVCIPIIEWFANNEPTRHIAGLVLVTTPNPEVYRRIGMFEDCWRTGEVRWVGEEREDVKIT